MAILNDLEQITDFSDGGTDPRPSLPTCTKCQLNTSLYSLSLFKKTIRSQRESLKKRLPVMFISRDPNVAINQIQQAGSPNQAIRLWQIQSRKGAIGRFMNDLIVQFNLWSEFQKYLANYKYSPRFY